MSYADLRKKYGLGTTYDEIRGKYGLSGTPKNYEEAQRADDLQGVGSYVSSFQKDWADYFKNGGTVSGNGYYDLAERKYYLLNGIDSMLEQYSGDAGATQYLTGLGDYLKGESKNVLLYDKINRYNQLLGDYNTSLEKINSYADMVTNSEYLDQYQLAEYSNAFDTYIRSGEKLFTVGNGYSDSDIKLFNDSKTGLGKMIPEILEYYGKYTDAQDFFADQQIPLHNHELARKEALDYDEKKGEKALEQLLEDVTSSNRESAELSNIELHLKYTPGGDIDWDATVAQPAFVGMSAHQLKALYYQNVQNAVGREVYEKALAEHENKLWIKRDYEYLDLMYQPDFETVVAAEKEKDADIDGRRTNELYGYEENIYYYIRATQGEDAADEYISHMKNSLKERRGWETARWLASRKAPGLASTLYGFGTGVLGGTRAIGELFTDLDPAVFDYANTSLQEGSYLTDTQKFFHQGAMTVGQQMPAMVATLITKNPNVGRMVSTATAYGLSEQQGRAMGMTGSQAREYALLNAAGELALETISDKLFGVVGFDDAGMFGKRMDNIRASLGRVAAKLPIQIVGEELEEISQAYLEPLFLSMVTGAEYEAPELDEILYTALLTAFSTGIMDLPGSTIRETGRQRNYRAIGQEIAKGDGVYSLKAKAHEADNATRRFNALYVTENPRNKREEAALGQLYTRLSKSEAKANASADRVDISHRLQKKGFSPDQAKAIADALVAQNTGQELTRAQEKALRQVKGDKKVEDVVSDLWGMGMANVGQDTSVSDIYRSAKLTNAISEITKGKTDADGKLTVDGYKAILEAAGIKAMDNDLAEDVDAVAVESGTEASPAAVDTTAPASDGQVTGKLDEAEVGADVEGKTFVKSTGEVAETVAVKDIGKGGVTLTVNEKTDAAMDDVSFGDAKTNEAFHFVTGIEGMTAEVANKILNHPDFGKENFARDAVRAFRAGVRNDRLVLGRLEPDVISKTDAESFFQKGREAVRDAKNAENKAVKSKATKTNSKENPQNSATPKAETTKTVSAYMDNAKTPTDSTSKRSDAEKLATRKKQFEGAKRRVSLMSPERQKYLAEKYAEYKGVLDQLEEGDNLVDDSGNVIGTVVGVYPEGISIIGEDGFIEHIPNGTFAEDSVISFLETGDGHFEKADGTRITDKPALVASVKTAKKTGKVYYGYDGKTIDEREGNLTQKQKADVNFTKRVAKMWGATYYFFESYQDENGNLVYKDKNGKIRPAKNGFYDPGDGSIHIDLNGDNMLFTIAHELVHFIRDWSPVRFKQMADLVMEGFNRQNISAEELIMMKQAEYAEDGIQLTEEQAFEEVIAASLEEILVDGRVYEFMQKIEAADKGLGAKIKKFFQDIANLIRDTIDSYKNVRSDSPEASIIRKMEDIYQKLQVAFAKGAMDAGKNFQKAENTTGEGGVRYSLVEPFIDNNGIKYDNAVLLDTQFFDGLSPRNWGTKLRNFVKFRSLTDRFVLPIYDENGVVQQLEFAKIRDRVSKNNGDDHPVLGELSSGKDNFSKLAVIHIDEIVDISNDDIPYYTPQKQTEKHGWMDQNGWLHRYSYVIDARKGTIYRLTFDIAKADDGRHILYATKGKIKKVGNANVNSLKIRGSKLNSGFVPSLAQYDPTVKRKDLEYLFAVDQKDMKTAQRMVDEAAKERLSKTKIRDRDGNLLVVFHATEADFTVFDRKKINGWNSFGNGFYFTPSRSLAKDYGSKIGAYFLNIRNPVDYYAVDKLLWADMLEHSGYDYDKEFVESYDEEALWDADLIDDFFGVALKGVNPYDAFADIVQMSGYDGIIAGDEIIAFDSNQVKSADPVTYDDDGNVIPLSERFNDNKTDIRYSVGRKTDQAVQEVLEAENRKLQEDVAKLKELVKLQGQETGGTKFTASSVLAAARYIKKLSNSKANTNELSGMLNDFYEYIATNKELTWEDVREQAQPIAQWLMDRVEHTRSDYAQEVLDQMKGGKVYLDETQMKEAEYLFGSYNDFRRSLGGAITVARNSSMSLDVWWQEMSTLYPDVFAVDVTASDMVRQLSDIVNSLRNENSSALEYAYNRRWIEQDLIRDIYDSFWRVSNLRTVADRYAAKHNKLVIEHNERINRLKTENREKIEQLKEQHRAEVEMIRNAYKEDVKETWKKAYRKARKKAVENRNKTEMRHKIQRVVKELNSLLLADDKKRHVPDNLKKAVAGALDILNLDTSNLEERVAKYEKLIAEETDPEKIDAYQLTMENIIHAGEKMGEKLGQLHSAYQAIANSTDPDIQGGYDSGIALAIQELSGTIGNTPINKLSMDQLEDVYNVYRAILNRVRDANNALADDQKNNITEWGKEVIAETKNAGGVHEDRVTALDGVKRFGWNNLKPPAAFDIIGSDALTRAFNNVRKGEDTWALDVTAARAFFLKVAKEYKYDSWDMDKTYTFQSTSGKKFKLTLEQMMSLYAYSKREAADEHLRLGGFVFDSNIEFKKEKENGKKSVWKYKINTAAAHQIDIATMQEIVKKVSEISGVTEFVDAMQDYLSTTMADKGNEVSRKMYGIKLFKEKNYFPLKSARQFLFEQNEVAGEVRIKNSGFTNKVKAGANNPIILSNFMDVWAQHVNDMSMYHAFTLPLEDFNRIFNFQTAKAEGVEPTSVKGTIQSAYGPAAVSYVQQLIKDLNGGAVTDPKEIKGQALISKWKKAKVMASLSVVVQQPTSIARAFALIDPKYFVGKGTGMSHAETWEELKTYAPVAIIKEMGHFDTGMGLGVKDYITQKEYEGFREKAKGAITDSNYRDELLGWAPAKADELTWSAIWNAVKRETAGRHPDLKPGTKEYLQAAGERFTEVITKTQVYDSVLAKSAHMRSKSTWMNIVTSFMAEPTTTINMAIDAVVKAARGDKKYARKAIKAVVISIVINNMASALVYAMRDDDEDETYWEKYLQSLASGLVDDFNPLTYFPWLKDVWSTVQGYDINRADMSLISELVDAGKSLYRAYDKDQNISRAWLDIAGTVGNLAGFPMENIIREGSAFANLWDTVSKDWTSRDTTWASLADAFGDAMKNSAPVYGLFADDNKTDDLYDAVTSGDETYIDRFKSGYVDKNGNFDEGKYNAALKQGLRDNDERIREAAEARISGDFKRYNELLTEVKNEGVFTHELIRDAIFAEEKDILKEHNGEETEKTDKEPDSYTSTFTTDDYFAAVFSGDSESTQMIYQDLLDDKLAEGYLDHEAKDAIANSLATEIGNRYMDGEISRAHAVKLLKENTDKGDAEVKKWDFEMQYGFAWSNRARRYRKGKISRSDLEKWVMDIEGADKSEAKAYVDFLDLEIENPDINITASDAESFFENAEPVGIDIDTYLEFKDHVSTIKSDVDPKTGKAKSGSKKEKVLKYIDSLPLSSAEKKDALYYSQNYAKSEINEAPWH